jgi:hypothetical protein
LGCLADRHRIRETLAIRTSTTAPVAPLVDPGLAEIANAMTRTSGIENTGPNNGKMSNDIAAIHGVMTNALTVATKDVAATVNLNAAARETGTNVPAEANAVNATINVATTTTIAALIAVLATTNLGHPELAVATTPLVVDPVLGAVTTDVATHRLTGGKQSPIKRKPVT